MKVESARTSQRRKEMKPKKLTEKEKKLVLVGEVKHAFAIREILLNNISDSDKLTEINQLSIGLLTKVSYK